MRKSRTEVSVESGSDGENLDFIEISQRLNINNELVSKNGKERR